MEGLDTPPMPSSASSFFSPLLISMFGIVITSIAIIIYHLFLVKYCLRRHGRNTTTTTTITAAQTTADAFPPTGVDQKVLEQIKISPFSTVKRDMDQIEECVVCLGELEDEDEVRVLPDCKHAFHVPCIDHWFAAHVTCPLCRLQIREQMSLEPCYLDSQFAVDNSDPECGGGSSTSTTSNSNRESWSRAQTFSVLRRCASMAVPPPVDRRSLTPPRLKRSLSMDPSLVVFNLQRVDCSNFQLMRTLSGSYRFPSSRFDRDSSKWLRSFSCLRLVKQSKGTILPY